MEMLKPQRNRNKISPEDRRFINSLFDDGSLSLENGWENKKTPSQISVSNKAKSRSHRNSLAPYSTSHSSLNTFRRSNNELKESSVSKTKLAREKMDVKVYQGKCFEFVNEASYSV